MEKNQVHKLIIIGSGPAGYTAAIYAARAALNPLVIEGKNPGGQLMGTSYVENWPGDKRVLGPELMVRMKEHAQSLGTTFMAHDIVKVNFSKRPFTLWTNRDKELKCHAVIIATGATSKRLCVPGEDDYWGKGVTTCAVCDGAFYKDKDVIIVGGGDTAMEDASFMTKYTNKITIIQVMEKLTASAAMQERVLNNKDIKILYNSTITAMYGDGKHVTQVTIKDTKTGKETKKSTDAVFVAIGLNPNTQIFKGHIALDKYGYVDVKNHTHTSVEGVFVAGDAADYRYRQAITSAGTGCMAALDAERYLSEQK